jgi:hypothetical protein
MLTSIRVTASPGEDARRVDRPRLAINVAQDGLAVLTAAVEKQYMCHGPGAIMWAADLRFMTFTLGSSWFHRTRVIVCCACW